MGRDCAEEIDLARKLATGFASEGIYCGLTLPGLIGKLVQSARKIHLSHQPQLDAIDFLAIQSNTRL